MAEELANVDKHFAVIEREMLPEDHESVSKCENGNIPKVFIISFRMNREMELGHTYI